MTAVIQGSSSGIGLQISRLLLQNTKCSVAALSRKPSEAKQAILKGLDVDQDRLLALEVDATREDSLKQAAEDVKSRFGKDNLRLLMNISGILKPEKSILKVDYEEALETFKINTLSHLLTYKYFVPLLPPKKDAPEKNQDGDPIAPYVKPGMSVLASLSARVGSIGENEAGGWYSYRSSKAAVNQIVKTLNQELKRRSAAPTIAISLHPGTTAYTKLSEGFVKEEDVNNKRGIHDPETAAKHLLNVISKRGPNDGGQFYAWDGDQIPW